MGDDRMESMQTALLVIDMQAALCSGEEAAFDVENVIERVNAVAAKARDAGAPVIVIQHEEVGGPLAHGSEGWQVDPRVQVSPADPRLRKTACDSFHRTPMHEQLRQLGVRHVVVCGLQSDFCVDSTVRGALAHGYPVTLVSDAHSTVDNGVLTAAQITAHHNQTLRNLGSFGPRVTLVPAAQVRFDRGPA